MNYFITCPRDKDLHISGLYPSENYLASLTLTQRYKDFRELISVRSLSEQPGVLIFLDLYCVVDSIHEFIEGKFNFELGRFEKVFWIVGNIRNGMRNTENVEIVRSDGPGDFSRWMGTRNEFEVIGSNHSVESHP